MSEESILDGRARVGAAPAKKKSIIFRIVRPLVAIGLLILLLRDQKLSDFIDLAQKASYLYLGIGVLVVILAVVVSAYKWQLLLEVQNVHVPLRRLFSTYLVGLFFNNFLPTNIGGDVVRIADVAKHTGKTSEAVASVIGERLLAAFALALTAMMGLALSFNVARGFAIIVAVLFAIALLIILLFANVKWRQAVGRKIKIPNVLSLQKWLNGVASSMSNCLRDRKTVVWVLFYSLMFNITVVLVNYFIFLALGLNVPFVATLLFTPIISAIQMLPISISGFGVREGAYVYFFGTVGLSSTEAIASSLIFWVLVALVSLAGGLIFAFRR